MRIAFVYDAVYPYKIGGVEKRIWEISRRLAKQNHEVHVFGMKLWDGPPDIIRDGVHLHGVCRKLPFHAGESGRRAIFPALWFSASLPGPLLRRGRFDLIDCQNFPYFPCFAAWLVSSLRRTPLVITWNEVWGAYWTEYIGKIGMIGKIIERVVARLTPNNAAISLTTMAQLHDLGVKTPIAITPCGVDLNKTRRVLHSPEISDIICIGRLIRDKHVDILIGAMGSLKASFPDLRCIIVGRGPEEERLRAQVLSCGLEKNVRFIGFVKDQDEILARIKASKVCVLPSTREGFGIVALEALACGTPVVTADHPGNAIRELTAIGGVRVVPLTTQDFAEAIRDQLLFPSPEGSARLEGEWDWDGVTGQWLKMADGFTRSEKTIAAKGSL
jgi:glycosyltransferase involved in cell wall biosynthesis